MLQKSLPHGHQLLDVLQMRFHLINGHAITAIKCKDPDYGNPISCDIDDITDANDDHVKDIWNMTPIKVVVGGPKVNNEPPAEPEPEADDEKAAGAKKGASKAEPDL